MQNIHFSKQLFYTALLYIIAFLLVSVVAFYRVFIIDQDIVWMKRSLMTITCGQHQLNINAWAILHMILYLLLGILAPAYWPIWIVVGIGWELFEYVINHYVTSYVDYKQSDIAVNTVALVLGTFLHDRLIFQDWSAVVTGASV